MSATLRPVTREESGLPPRIAGPLGNETERSQVLAAFDRWARRARRDVIEAFDTGRRIGFDTSFGLIKQEAGGDSPRRDHSDSRRYRLSIEAYPLPKGWADDQESGGEPVEWWKL